MKKLILLAGLFLYLSAPAFAQDTPMAEVFGGYSFVRSSGVTFNGWNGALEGNLNKWLGFVGDFSGHYKSISGTSVRLHTFTIGPQVSFRGIKKATPYAHALFGGARTSVSGSPTAQTVFAMNFGGGLDWNWSDLVAFRLIQADAFVTRNAGFTTRDARLSFGIVLRLGRRR
ncbi:MAG: hypothetical protein DMG29_10725 [Acidobacteria bacterium]|nr:MAG: hypothetical protein DMG29_10725 [Acidobacteriota bacterium]